MVRGLANGADLLMAALSPRTNVALLERAEISRILKEQQLSAIVNTYQALGGGDLYSTRPDLAHCQAAGN